MRAKRDIVKDWGALFLVVAVALAVRLCCFSGAGFEDDQGFTEKAWALHQGRIDSWSDQTLRILTYAPLALSYSLFGEPSETATHLPHLFLGLATIGLVFFITRLMYGTGSATFAALFLAFFPVHVQYSTRTMPEIPESFFAACSMALLVWIFCAEIERGLVAAGALAGVFAACAYLARETGIVFVAVVSAALLLETIFCREKRALRVRLFCGFVCGAALVAVVESMAGFWFKGDGLLRWHLVHFAQNWNVNDVAPGAVDFYWQYFAGVRDLPADFRFCPGPGLQGWAVIVAAFVFSVRQRKAPAREISFWFWAYALFLSFGSTSFNEYHLIRRFPRYAILLLPPASIMAGWILREIWKVRLRGVRVGGVVAVGLCALMFSWSLRNSWLHHEYVRGVFATQRRLDALLSSGEFASKRVWLENWQIAIRNRGRGFIGEGRVDVIGEMNLCNHGEGYVVLMEDLNSGSLCLKGCGEAKFSILPPEWRRVVAVDSEGGKYLVPGSQPVIYYAPAVGDYSASGERPAGCRGVQDQSEGRG